MIEPNAAATTEVTADSTSATTATPETNVTTDPTVVTATPDATDPQPTANIIDELKSVYKQINDLQEQLDAVMKQRDQLLANSDACSSIKQEINRLLAKLVPYANSYANFIQSLQNNLNNIEVSAKVDPEFFSNLTSFTDDCEPNDAEVANVVAKLGGTPATRAGFSPFFNSVVQNAAKLKSDVVGDVSKNVVAPVKTLRPVASAS